MKKVSLILFIFITSLGNLCAIDKAPTLEPLRSRGFKVGVGALVEAKSPLLAAGPEGTFSYNPDFAVKFKKFGIDDWLFGFPIRMDWVFEKRNGFGLGFQLDIDSTLMITGSYSQITDILKEKIETAIESFGSEQVAAGEGFDLEYGARADITPMFLINYRFVRFSLGLGATFQVNGDHAKKSIESLKEGGTQEMIQTQLTRIGMTSEDPRYFAITDKDSLNRELTNYEKIGFYGLGLDLHLKMNLDFTLGKHFLVGGNFLLRMNSQMALWEKEQEFSENMKVSFDPKQFEGAIGFRVMWIF